jgi:hypothetical protein
LRQFNRFFTWAAIIQKLDLSREENVTGDWNPIATEPMAHPTYEESAFDPASLQLSTNEQSLLITALNSNKPARNGSYSTLHITNGRKAMSPIQNGSTFTSPNQQAPGSTAVTSLDFDASPFLDYDLEDGNFENWDMNGGQMIGDLPGTSVSDEDQEHHDKRKKSSDDNGEDDEDGGGKRREGDDRSAKKPGRKPLTSEPTTKRKVGADARSSNAIILTHTYYRLRIVLPSAHSENEKSNISRIWRPRSRILRKLQSLRTMKTACSVPKSSA